ncbi:MAG: hypothetical protein CM15mV34_1610 [Caudoviricetes sp.]|nr:MAG: hypothetical protein CM15mV34_1610 [Caudoviricetes sp.]
MCCATKPNPKAKKQRVANVGLTSEASVKRCYDNCYTCDKKEGIDA